MSLLAALRRYRVGRHAALTLAGCLGLAAIIALTPGSPAIARLSLGLAYVGLAFLAISLVLGPLNLLNGRRNPLSSTLRRDIGIQAGIFALLHTVIGLQVHMGGRIRAYFLEPRAAGWLPVRGDAFGLANHTGLVAAGIMVMLLSLSSNAALRRLQARRWKALQRWNYAAAACIALHGALYQMLERREVGFIALFLSTVILVIGLQVAGARRRLRADAAAPLA